MHTLSGADFSTLVALARMPKGALAEEDREHILAQLDSDYARRLARSLVQDHPTNSARSIAKALRHIRQFAGVETI